jgi:hypothetical protein
LAHIGELEVLFEEKDFDFEREFDDRPVGIVLELLHHGVHLASLQ